MRIASLIKKLESLKQKHGNVGVYHEDDYDVMPIKSVHAADEDGYRVKRGKKASFVTIQTD